MKRSVTKTFFFSLLPSWEANLGKETEKNIYSKIGLRDDRYDFRGQMMFVCDELSKILFLVYEGSCKVS